MSSDPTAPIDEILYPGGRLDDRLSLYGVLDCARDRMIYLALLQSRLEFRCLYSGNIPRALEQSAPHLVEVLPSNRLTKTWLHQAFGQSWGVLVRIEDTTALRHHLRKLLTVRDEQGRRLLFRFYDPRVLRVYLPTCRADELKQVFGPIDSFLTESDDGSSLLEFRLVRDELRVRSFPVRQPS